ncbi:hypothetical protein BYT27DRAFT_7115211 [Phlegmacium glaucopus]|nr:hypothetical protein BYT27DRAFT_7115211 [Phlegmacium glaucopus]
MFFYLSFLRPPPLQAPPYGTISITPQISNDLRTEPFESSQDLYFSWSLQTQTQPHISISTNTTTKPIKLTTWRPSIAYKEIPVPVPPGVREGQSWRLILIGTAQSHGRSRPEAIDLSSEEIGKSLPFPVMSMPVLFSARGAKNASKQEKVDRIYLLPLNGLTGAGGPGEDIESVDSSVASLRFTEQTSFDLDKKIWDSGIGLSSWLVDFKENFTQRSQDNTRLQHLHDSLFSNEPRNILELGAGIGMVSVVLGVLRSGLNPQSSEGGKDCILTTDVPSAMPLLVSNISVNAHFCPSTTPKALVLDWDDEELPKEVQDVENLNVIIMADVSYNTSSFLSLARTLSRLVRLGSKPPIILLGYKERDAAERTWWEIAAQAGIDFEEIGGRIGAGGAPVEIWVGYAHM